MRYPDACQRMAFPLFFAGVSFPFTMILVYDAYLWAEKRSFWSTSSLFFSRGTAWARNALFLESCRAGCWPVAYSERAWSSSQIWASRLSDKRSYRLGLRPFWWAVYPYNYIYRIDFIIEELTGLRKPCQDWVVEDVLWCLSARSMNGFGCTCYFGLTINCCWCGCFSFQFLMGLPKSINSVITSEKE